MIQLPAGAAAAMPAQERDFGLGCWPGGVPGTQIRHSPALGRWPGGTPSVAAVLGPRFDSAGGAPRTCGSGSTTRILVLRVQALTANSPAMASRPGFIGPP